MIVLPYELLEIRKNSFGPFPLCIIDKAYGNKMSTNVADYRLTERILSSSLQGSKSLIWPFGIAIILFLGTKWAGFHKNKCADPGKRSEQLATEGCNGMSMHVDHAHALKLVPTYLRLARLAFAKP